MEKAIAIYKAFTALNDREYHFMSHTPKMMVQTTLSELESDLTDTDYVYIALYIQSIVEAKKLCAEHKIAFEPLALFAHAFKTDDQDD